MRNFGLAKLVRGSVMFLKNNLHASVCMVICMFSVLIVGCSTNGAKKTQSDLPSPAVEQGMTLDWGLDVKKQAMNLIVSSKHQCYLDIYELSDSDIINALAEAHHRGVDVRVVLDATEKHSITVGLNELQKGQVPVKVLSISRGISHIKMLYVDGHVLIGGMNYGADSWSNNDASVFIEHPNLSFRSLFLWDYNRAQDIPSPATAAVLPLVYDRNIKLPVLRAIQNAHHSIVMEAFDLTDTSVIHSLKAAALRGVTVEILLDPTQSFNRKAASALRETGIIIRFYRPYHNELMHAKIVDVDYGQTFIIGSANFSNQAYAYNHEGDLVLHDVPAFDASLQNDLSIQISRGTDYPVSGKHSSW
jgi:cardiolipin synthase A/B